MQTMPWLSHKVEKFPKDNCRVPQAPTYFLLFFHNCLLELSIWLSFAVLASHLGVTKFSSQPLWSLSGYNPLLYFLLVSPAVSS